MTQYSKYYDQLKHAITSKFSHFLRSSIFDYFRSDKWSDQEALPKREDSRKIHLVFRYGRVNRAQIDVHDVGIFHKDLLLPELSISKGDGWVLRVNCEGYHTHSTKIRSCTLRPARW